MKRSEMTRDAYEVQELNRKGRDYEEQEPRRERRRRLAKQVSLVLMVTLSCVSLGNTHTWPSPALSSLANDNSTLVGTEISLTAAEMDMTGSLVYLGSLFGAWGAGWMVDRIGRRRSMQMLVAPFVVGWLVTGLAPNSALLLTGRFIQGIGGGAVSIATYSYVVELPDKCIRGMMVTLQTLGVVTGNLYTVALGYALPWYYLCFMAIIPPIIFLITTFFLPESPSYLVVKGKHQKAIHLLNELRGKYVDVEDEVKELERMNSRGSGGWKGLMKKDVLRRIGIVVMVFFLSQMSGNFVLMIYTTRILQMTGAPMNPNAITAITGVLRVGGTTMTIFLLDVLGRRYCLLISHAINATCLFVLGTFVHLAEAAEPDDETFSKLTWVPMVCVMASLFFCDMGVHPIPFIIASEYFPTNIRAQASSICFSCGTIIIFAVVQLYSPMLDLLGQARLYWLYGSTSVVGVFFALFIVIETKGKAVG